MNPSAIFAGPNPFPQGGVLPLHCSAFAPKPPDCYFDADAADAAVAFFGLLKHTQGPKAGQPFELAPEQEWVVREAFGWMREDGTRLYRTIYVETGRANGKTQFGAGIAGKLLLADGEADPEVIGAAKDRRQARICLDRLKAMVRQSPALDGKVEILRGMIRRKADAGWYEATSADVGSAWGGAPHGVIFDEVHAQPNRELWDALVTGTGKRRQPMVWAFTTAGWDRESLAWELHEYTRELGEGTIQDPSFLGVVWAAEEEDDWTSPEVWRKANPLMGVAFEESFLAGECRKAKSVPAFQNTFRTMYLSQWVGSSVRFLPMDDWDACGASLVDPMTACFGGLDLSSTTDLSAFSIVYEQDGTVYVRVKCYAPKEGIRERSRRDRLPYEQWAREGWLTLTEGASIDQDVIKFDVLAAAGALPLEDISYDRWNASKLVRELETEGVNMVQVGQGFATMSAPTKELIRLVVEHKLAHGGNPLLRAQVNATQAQTDPAGNVKPDKKKSGSRIDAVVSTVMALDGLTRRGRQVQRRSVYEDRGLMQV